MMEWWDGLELLNKIFYGAAGFFSIIFLWQFIATLIGLSHGEGEFEAGGHGDADHDVDVHVDGDADVHVDHIEADSAHAAAESTAAFRILSVRAILAFFTLFTWAGALYLDVGKDVPNTLILAMMWGLAGWAVVAVLVYWLRKLAEPGTARLSSCVGCRGSVYLNIPAGGQGEIRVPVGGVITMVKARAAGGAQMGAGTPVHVVRLLDAATVEVAPVDAQAGAAEDRQ